MSPRRHPAGKPPPRVAISRYRPRGSRASSIGRLVEPVKGPPNDIVLDARIKRKQCAFRQSRQEAILSDSVGFASQFKYQREGPQVNVSTASGSLEGRVSIVTGGGRGLGRAMARGLA